MWDNCAQGLSDQEGPQLAPQPEHSFQASSGKTRVTTESTLEIRFFNSELVPWCTLFTCM